MQDLKQRGMLDDTLVIWGGEFGRTIYSQGKLTPTDYGRDHHPRCFSLWMAGGGIKGGVVHGETDEFSYNIVKDPVHVRDFQATILHQFGIDHERFTYSYQGLDREADRRGEGRAGAGDSGVAPGYAPAVRPLPSTISSHDGSGFTSGRSFSAACCVVSTSFGSSLINCASSDQAPTRSRTSTCRGHHRARWSLRRTCTRYMASSLALNPWMSSIFTSSGFERHFGRCPNTFSPNTAGPRTCSIRDERRSDEVVGDRHLLVLGVEDALVGFRPRLVQRPDLVSAFQCGGQPQCVETVDRILHGHLGREDFVVSARHLEQTMPGVRLKNESVARVVGDLQYTVDRNVPFGDVELQHVPLAVIEVPRNPDASWAISDSHIPVAAGISGT